MPEQKDELRGYLLEEKLRNDKLQSLKSLPLFGIILPSVVGLIGFSAVEGIVFGIKFSLILTVIMCLFWKGVFLLAEHLGLDQDASYCIDPEGISTTVRKKKYEQHFAWSEIAEVSEIITWQTVSKYDVRKIPYLVLAKKPLRELNLLIAADAEHAMESYAYLCRHPDLIAIPKTEEAVRYIERFRKINPLPEKYKLS